MADIDLMGALGHAVERARAERKERAMTDYTPTTEEVRMAYGDVHCFDPDAPHDHVCPADHAFGRWLAAHDAQKRAEWEAEQEADDEPCKAEVWSWDIFRHQEVDPYWMRCHLVGPHEKHENSETGATWPVERSGESR